MQKEGERLDFRSPSLELAKIQVSPGFLPKREPSGSVLITCSMAFPTSPEPPVTRITSPLAMIIKESNDGLRWTQDHNDMIGNVPSDDQALDLLRQICTGRGTLAMINARHIPEAKSDRGLYTCTVTKI